MKFTKVKIMGLVGCSDSSFFKVTDKIFLTGFPEPKTIAFHSLCSSGYAALAMSQELRSLSWETGKEANIRN